MKNLFKTLLISAFFILNWHIATAQNDPTIYTLTAINQDSIIDSIQMKIASVGGMAPSEGVLKEFLGAGLTNQFYPHSPNSCLVPGIQPSDENGNLSLDFNNFPSSSRDMLFVSELEYGGGQNNISHAVYGEEAYNGISFPLSTVVQHIFLVGSYCINCQNPASTFNNQCASNWEVIVIEKHIL